MQEKSEPQSEFSERTERLSLKIGVRLSDLPEKIGVSESMFFAYRSGKQPISAKAWRKLEAAERAEGSVPAEIPIEAGSHPFQKDDPGDSVVRDAEVDYQTGGKPQIFASHPSRRLREIQAQVEAFQEELAAMTEPAQEAIANFPMAELIFWMKQAKAWPPEGEDETLIPAALWRKYGPPATSEP